MSKKAKHTAAPDAARILSASVLGLAYALAALIPLLLLGAALCMLADDPNRLAAPTAIVCSNLCALIGGMLAVRKSGGAPLACGLLGGSLWVLVFLLLSWCFRGTPSLFSGGAQILLRLLGMICFMLGALIGTRRKKIRHRRRQKR